MATPETPEPPQQAGKEKGDEQEDVNQQADVPAPEQETSPGEDGKSTPKVLPPRRPGPLWRLDVCDD